MLSIASGIYVKKYEATTLFLSIKRFKLQKGIWLNCNIDFYSIHICGFCDWFQTKCTWSYHKLLSKKCCFQTKRRSRSEILDSLYSLRKCKHSNHHSNFFIFLLKIMPSNIMMSKRFVCFGFWYISYLEISFIRAPCIAIDQITNVKEHCVHNQS